MIARATSQRRGEIAPRAVAADGQAVGSGAQRARPISHPGQDRPRVVQPGREAVLGRQAVVGRDHDGLHAVGQRAAQRVDAVQVAHDPAAAVQVEQRGERRARAGRIQGPHTLVDAGAVPAGVRRVIPGPGPGVPAAGAPRVTPSLDGRHVQPHRHAAGVLVAHLGHRLARAGAQLGDQAVGRTRLPHVVGRRAVALEQEVTHLRVGTRQALLQRRRPRGGSACGGPPRSAALAPVRHATAERSPTALRMRSAIRSPV